MPSLTSVSTYVFTNAQPPFKEHYVINYEDVYIAQSSLDLSEVKINWGHFKQGNIIGTISLYL